MPHFVHVIWEGENEGEILPDSRLSVKPGECYAIGEKYSAKWGGRLYGVEIQNIFEVDESEDLSDLDLSDFDSALETLKRKVARSKRRPSPSPTRSQSPKSNQEPSVDPPWKRPPTGSCHSDNNSTDAISQLSAQLLAGFQSLESKLTSRFDCLEQKVDSMTQQVQTLDARVSDIEITVSTLHSLPQAFPPTSAPPEAGITEVSPELLKLQSINDRLLSVEQNVAQLTGNSTTILNLVRRADDTTVKTHKIICRRVSLETGEGLQQEPATQGYSPPPAPPPLANPAPTPAVSQVPGLQAPLPMPVDTGFSPVTPGTPQEAFSVPLPQAETPQSVRPPLQPFSRPFAPKSIRSIQK